jgi:hypothetical protein
MMDVDALQEALATASAGDAKAIAEEQIVEVVPVTVPHGEATP